MTMNIPALGLHPDVSNDAYHSGPGVSKSHLDDIAEECGNSPRHYWAKRIDPEREPVEKTPALILGDAIHKAILEPDEIVKNFVTIPEDAPKKPSITQVNAKKPSLETQGAVSYWRDFAAEAGDRFILKPEDMGRVIACRDAVHRHPEAKLLFQGGAPEQTYYALDPDTHELIKCRVDYDRLEADGRLIDLKTTEHAGPEAFGSSATKYRYDVQGVWYPDVIEAAYGPDIVDSFVFVAVEKDPPHAIGIYWLEAEDMAPARELARRDLNRIVECRTSGVWPDFGANPGGLRIRKYARRPAA